MKTKKCSKCKKEKPLESFAKCKDQKVGRQSYCKVCKASYDAKNDSKTYMVARDHRKKKSPIPIGDKHCSRCGLLIPLKDYYRSALEPDGFFDLCKSCCKTHNAYMPEDKQLRHYANYFRSVAAL